MSNTTNPRHTFNLGAPNTPEAHFKVRSNGVPIDAVNCCLTRAKAILELVQANGADGEFTLDHDTVMASLWATVGLIEMAHKALKGGGDDA